MHQGQICFAFGTGAPVPDGGWADNRPMASPDPSLQAAPLEGFHPAVAAWFAQAFAAPTQAQRLAWPAIRSGRHVLVSAPTGSGKTLTAFLAGIDQLVRDGLDGGLADATRIVYVSPLKALSNDIRINLELPLQGIRAQLARMGLPDVEIRTAVRTGDTPQSERAAMRRKPPHILVTTPESLYILLGSESGRAMLAPAGTVIVDEIHAVAASKRGSHLALSLERLEALCGRPLVRIGVSATQKPIDEVARFLVGAGNVVRGAGAEGPGAKATAGATGDAPCTSADPGAGEPQGGAARHHARPAEPVADCEIVELGYDKQRDLALVLPPTPLSVVMSNAQWEQVYAQLAELAGAHSTTLVFVNTRRMAERAARHLGELLGKARVAAHHGSLAKELRLEAEQKLKRGELSLLVATSSLELGIDIGDVDLVCQLGSPRAISAFLQRAGRSGHHVGGVPRARLFPQSRDDLVECAALLDCVRRGELDALRIPGSDPARGLAAPVDVLAQQIVAEVSCREWREDALYDWMRRAWPYRDLSRAAFDAVVKMLAEGYATRRGVRSGLLHRDAVNGLLRGRQGGRATAVMSGGTIPETADYTVLMEPQSIQIGTVHEDFAVESLAGDVFQLGNASYRVLRIEPGRLRVEDAQGAAPSIPFWIGEAPGRTDELSIGVSRLREEVVTRLGSALATPVAHSFPESGRWHEADATPPGSASGDVRIAALAGEDLERAEPPPPAPLPVGEGGDASCSRQEETQLAPRSLQDGTQLASCSLREKDRDEGAQHEISTDASRDAHAWLTAEVGLAGDAATQIVDYLAATRAALGTLPTRRRIVLERFFDESGGTQLVIHAPFGSRLNRAWGLALRKRFCRKFNFELQAAATEDAIVLSLSTSHSFPLVEVAQYLHSNSALEILTQALLDAPLFGVRWRWNATTALALPRFLGGKKVAPQLQRMKSEDLLATVFPDQVACAENLVGEREVPDHPLVAQTLHDCLHEAMDAAGWLDLLRGMESGAVEVVARDLTAPSPLAMEAINARPYAFLDDAPLEERRTQAVQARRYADPAEAGDLGRLDPGAIEAVREQAWPTPRNADEMHEALQALGVVTADEAAAHASWAPWLSKLAKDQRATRLRVPLPAGQGQGGRDGAHTAPGGIGDTVDDASVVAASGAIDLWVCAERLVQLRALCPEAVATPRIALPPELEAEHPTREAAALELLRARLGGLGPATVAALQSALPLPRGEIEFALQQLQAEGVAMQGWFTRAAPDDAAQAQAGIEWCERHLLARIHRYTLARLRKEIEPVEPRDFVRFLCDWQRVSPAARVSGSEALAGVLAQLEGYEAPAAAWEAELLPARVADYAIAWLDDQCAAGRTLWTRLRASDAEAGAARTPVSVRATPVVLLPRRQAAHWTRLSGGGGDAAAVSSRGRRVLDHLSAHGASFFDDLADGTRLLRTELEDALAELVARGRIHCDSFAGLRALLVPGSKRPSARASRQRRAALFGIEDAGRWALIPGAVRSAEAVDAAAAEPRRAAAAQGPGPAMAGDLLARQHDAPAPPAGAGKRAASARRGDPAARKPERDDVEHVARILLRRYGVVCWRLLDREAAWLPPWRELVRVLHRLEARGEIRGGRFIAGLSGEQFALPEAIGLLRQVRARPCDGQYVCLSASDPLNLAGTLLPGDKVPRLPGARVLLRDGLVVARLVAGEVQCDDALPQAHQALATRLLLREHGPGLNLFSAPAPTPAPVLTD